MSCEPARSPGCEPFLCRKRKPPTNVFDEQPKSMKVFRTFHLSGWQRLLGCGCVAIASLTLNAGESVYPGDLSPETYYNDAPNLEFGTVFRPTLPGRITQVRVFALAEETGSHAVRIWRNSPQALLFSTNWNFGGQQSAWIALAIPALQLESGVDYTVAISAPAEGWYPINSGYFNTAGNNGLHLAFPQGAGVFSDTAGVRPTTSEHGLLPPVAVANSVSHSRTAVAETRCLTLAAAVVQTNNFLRTNEPRRLSTASIRFGST